MPVDVLSDAESRRLVEFVSSQKQSRCSAFGCLRNQLFVLLMLDAGLRVGEVVQLTFSNFFTGGSVNTSVAIEASTTKTGSARQVPMTQRLIDATVNWCSLSLDKWKEEPNAYIFPGTNGVPYFSTRQVNRLVNKWSIKCLQRPAHPHVLRHTFATRLMRSAPQRVVQELLGHKSLSSTQVYTHPNTNDLHNAIKSMA